MPTTQYKYAEQCATFFAVNGFYVLPCCDWRDPEIRGQLGMFPKHPLWSFKDSAPPTLQVLQRYFYSTPLFRRYKPSPFGEYYPKTSCFAIRTGKYEGRLDFLRGKYLVGIDCDNKNGENGVEYFRRHFGVQDHDTFSVETPRGEGRHFYFVSDVPVGTFSSVMPGIDVRGYHGLLYMPGSSYLDHDLSEKSYRIIEHELRKIAPIPQAVLNAIVESRGKLFCENDEERQSIVLTSHPQSDSDDSIRCDSSELMEKIRNCPLDGEIAKENLDATVMEKIRREVHAEMRKTLFEIRDEAQGKRNDSQYRKGGYLFAFSPRYLSSRTVESLIWFAACDPDRIKVANSIESSRKSDKADKPHYFCRDFNLDVHGYWCRSDPLFRQKFAVPTDFGRIERRFFDILNALGGKTESQQTKQLLYNEMTKVRNAYVDELDERFYECCRKVFACVPHYVSEDKANEFLMFITQGLPVTKPEEVIGDVRDSLQNSQEKTPLMAM